MYRTFNKSQAFETKFEELMSKHPCMRFFVTATPVPALLALSEEEEVKDIKFKRTVPCDDYLGVDQMVSVQVLCIGRINQVHH